MRNAVCYFFCTAMIAAAPVFASGDHDHAAGGHSHATISSDAAAAMAAKKVEELVGNGKLDKSWSGLAAAKTEQKDFGKGKEWVVSFNNPGVADKSKQTLYVFFDASGHYLAANYTGQ